MPKAVRSKATASIQHFEAPLERLPSRLQWTIVYLGFDAGKVWGLRGQIKVKGEINGFPFRSSLFPTRQGRHFLLINKAMQRGAGVAEGKVARLAIELDREERTVDPPIQLTRILRQDRSLRRWYDELNYSTRNDIAKWIREPKGDEARERRADQIAERGAGAASHSSTRICSAAKGSAGLGDDVAIPAARASVWHLLLPHPRSAGPAN